MEHSWNIFVTLFIFLIQNNHAPVQVIGHPFEFEEGDAAHHHHSHHRQERDLQSLRSGDPYNRLLLTKVKQPGQVVRPLQVEKGGRLASVNTRRHRIRHLGTHEHVDYLTVQVVIKGQKHKIKLNKNEVLLSSGILVKTFAEKKQQIISKTVEHCYYHGYVKRDEWSSVAVSTCNGLRGVIQMQNETYIIQPLVKGDKDKEHPHLLFQASVSPKESCGNTNGLWMPFQELHKRELIKRRKFLNAQRSHYHRAEDTTRKLLRIGMVLDKSMAMGNGSTTQQVVQYALDVANIADLYLRQLRFDISLTYLEYWNIHDRFPVGHQPRALLNEFLHYKKEEMPKDLFDAAFFVTGDNLDDNSVGIAIPESICSKRAVAVVKRGRPFEPQQTATVLSHMAGHILGIEHDEDEKWRKLYHEGGCYCKDEFGCIMSTKVLGTGGYHSRMFSSCSSLDLEASVDMGITSCLWGALNVQSDFKQTCGNNIVERGEECDCGTPEECQTRDPCCDPSTCLLQPWAQCRSGPCCANCTFLPKTHLCRPRQLECDIPEYCSGESGECPVNTYIRDGHPCANQKGYCMGGLCPTLNKQCQAIWGSEAKGGHEQCFQRFNPTGNFNGHCGKYKITGNYAKCQHHDISCGLLHCEGGKSSPLYGSDKGFSTTHVNANSMEYECKTVHGPAMMDMPHMGMVQDGTKCGSNKVCIRNACVTIPRVPTLNCPSNDLALICSGHGVCAKDDSCFCDQGWEGWDCSEPTNETLLMEEDRALDNMMAAPATQTTTTAKMEPVAMSDAILKKAIQGLNQDKELPLTSPIREEGSGISTQLLIIILATVIGGLFLVMGVTLMCYRRRAPPKKVPVFASKDSSGKTAAGTKNKKRPKKRWGIKKKGLSSEEESEMGEMYTPPIVVMDPDSVMPEKGILKNSMARLAALENRGSSDSNGGSYRDRDSVGPYMYDEDEDAEIRNIFRDDSAENMDHLQESASFDFVIPPPPQPPPPQVFLPGYYPSPATLRRAYDANGTLHSECDYVNGMHHLYEPVQPLPQQSNPTWRTALPPQTLSPPQSRIVKLRNLNDYMLQFNKATIDLSPSPDDPPPQQLSPSTCTSEDVRSSETEPDRFQRASHSDHSPTSNTSGSTLNTGRPSFGNLSQYLLKRNDTGSNGDPKAEDQAAVCKGADLPSQSASSQNPSQANNLSSGLLPNCRASTVEDPSSIIMPPPMNPINIHSIFSIGHKPAPANRESSNTTPHGSVNEDNSSHSGTTSSKYDKSSGYGSEQDHERFSTEDTSRSDSQSRSNSLSRSHSASPPSYSAVIRTGPNRIQLVPAGHNTEEGRDIEGIQQELNRLLENLPRIHAGSFERSPLQSSATPSTPLTGPLPASRPLMKEESLDGSAPCIDRSLEEIPAHFTDKKKRSGSYKASKANKGKRFISVAVQGKLDRNTSNNSSLEEVPSIAAEDFAS